MIDLGLDVGLSADTTISAVVANLFKYELSEIEHKLPSKGLKLGIFPAKLNFILVQAEFEDFYQQFSPTLTKSKPRLELKKTLITLYSKFKSSFLYSLKHNNAGLSTQELEVLQQLAINSLLIIC